MRKIIGFFLASWLVGGTIAAENLTYNVPGGQLKVGIDAWLTAELNGWPAPSEGTGSVWYWARLRPYAKYSSKLLTLFVEPEILSIANSDNTAPAYSSHYKADTLLYQAWAELKTPLGVFAKVGRQEMMLANGRLISPKFRLYSGASVDGIQVGYRNKKLGLKAITFFFKPNESTRPAFLLETNKYFLDTETNYFGFYVEKKFLGWLKGAFTYLGEDATNDWIHPTKGVVINAVAATYGVWLKGNHKSGFNCELEFYKQSGHKDIGSKHLSLKGYMWAANAGYTFKKLAFKPFVNIGFENYSGDNNLNDGDQKAWEMVFYVAGHKFNGFMDYNPYLIVTGKGIKDYYLKTGIKVKKTSLQLHYHKLQTDVSVGGSKDVGNELDLLVLHPINKHIKVRFELSKLWAGDAAHNLINPATGQPLVKKGENPVKGLLAVIVNF